MGAQPRFLAATDRPHPRAVLFGAPLDATESFKSGTAEAPTRIRAVSDVLESYSPVLDRDLDDIGLADWGDVACVGVDLETALRRIEGTMEHAVRQGLALMMGGEHTATLGAVRGARHVYPDLHVIQLDAHLDLRDQYNGATLSHATVLRRVADEIGLDHLVQLGIRSGTREEFELAHGCILSRMDLSLDDAVRRYLRDVPIYLTIDIDVLDPGGAPGTGCPEPGGQSFLDLMNFVYSLADLKVIAGDVMEVLPACDSNDVTSVTAAKLIREMALLFAKQRL